MLSTSSRLLLCLCACCVLLVATPAWADTVLAAKRIDLPGASLQDVQARLAPGVAPDTVRISLRAGRADIPSLGWRHVGLSITGDLKRDPGMRWLFEGTAQVNGAPGGALGNAKLAVVVDSAGNTLEIDAGQGAAHIGTAFPLDQPTHAQVNLRNLPAGWLQGVLGTVWAGRIAGGRLDADLALDVRDEGIRSSGDFTVEQLKYVTPDGNPVSQGLAGRGRFAIDATHHPAQIALNGNLRGGSLQFGPVLARLPSHEVLLDLDAEVERGGLDVMRLHLDDPDALQLVGALSIDAKGNLQRLRLEHFQARFPAAYDRYGQPWLDALVAPNLRIDGQLDGHIDVAGDTWRSFAFHTDRLDVADASGQRQVQGLRGGLDWSAQGERPSSTLAWNQLTLRGIATGPAQSHWRSHNGDLALQAPLAIPLFKGQAVFTQLDWRPAAPQAQRLGLAARLTGLDMATLNQAFGWTPFAGTLDGSIPAIHWAGQRYALDGALTIKAFDGTATLSHLSAQQPFGDSPVLAGDMALHQLDLAALTSAFNFGAMSGRLDGSINGLQLVDGSPVAFKASFQANNGGRISQRAADNLSIVTGGSAAGGLQGAMLKLFKTLAFKRLGLNSNLQNGVCTMGGLDSDANGYTIVEGSGLPYLRVAGEQTRIEWLVLLRRLKAATQGANAER